MITVRDLYKHYHGPHGSGWVLKGLNFTIPKGVSVGVEAETGPVSLHYYVYSVAWMHLIKVLLRGIAQYLGQSD
ncbi:hypothetical protein ALON55S_06168 [Alishewanella longhuensis]